ncbi:Uncharacterised protein [Mycobacteroides abscessus subsp. abscessus]|nr:Uncharacterised protein [Mycobacteroides abscessus subsp. abscessus]
MLQADPPACRRPGACGPQVDVSRAEQGGDLDGGARIGADRHVVTHPEGRLHTITRQPHAGHRTDLYPCDGDDVSRAQRGRLQKFRGELPVSDSQLLHQQQAADERGDHGHGSDTEPSLVV